MDTNNLYEISPVALLESPPSSAIRLRELIDTEAFREATEPLIVPIGVDTAGEPTFIDIAKTPHLLIGGRSGAGKSMWLHGVITSLLCKNSPNKVNLLLIDPKMIEFEDYCSLPHLAIPIARRWQEGIDALNWAVNEMKRRLELPNKESLPRIVVIIDELADLMRIAPDEVEESICKLVQMGHKVGLHLIIATQCPRTDILTGLIKANILSRIAFAVASQEDSLCILDTAAAEQLNGQGDMLYVTIGGAKPIRLQGAYVSGRETERIVTFIKEHNGERTE